MYKYAQQLKEAGFPQNEPDRYTSDGQWIPEDERIYIPTLSEVIRECGQFLSSLYRVSISEYSSKSDKKSKGGWEAISIYDSTWEWGETIEEAVVKLWLTLNNK